MSRRSGFTLIETLIALAILTIAAVGPLYSVSRSLIAAQNSANVLTATHLAQEGVEYVRWMRDNSYLYYFSQNDPNASESAWTDFLSGSTNAWSVRDCIVGCTLDATKQMGTGIGLAINACSGTCSPLYLSSVGYTQDSTGAVTTPFTRTIRVTQLSSKDAKVSSTVRWNFHSIPFTITVTNQLTPWQ